VNAQSEEVYANLILSLLLDGSWGPDAPGEVDWARFLAIAKQNTVLVRVADRLADLSIQTPSFFGDAAEEERQRVRATIDLIRTASDVCSDHRIECLFPKAFQHYPDMGHDVDLLVLARSAEVDRLIADALDLSPRRRGLGNWIAGTVGYEVDACGSPLEIHHGRMGNLGEQTSYPGTLLMNRRRRTVEAAIFDVPSREDQLVLQGMQRVYGRRCLRLSDVVYTISSIRHDDLDWSYVLGTAKRIGIFHGLCCYLAYVDQIHGGQFNRDLLPAELRKALILDGWGRVGFRDGYYKFPFVRVGSVVYTRKFLADAASGDWGGAARLGVLPLLAAATALRGLAGGVRGRRPRRSQCWV